MSVDQSLYDAAVVFIRERFPNNDPFVGAAAARTVSGRLLVSTSFETPNEAACLCHETGAICEAFKYDDPISAIICLNRDRVGKFRVLAPCGICQERLFTWGGEVLVAVPEESDTTKWETRRLHELQPYYWFGPYRDAT